MQYVVPRKSNSLKVDCAWEAIATVKFDPVAGDCYMNSKKLDFVATGGGQACAIPFNRWRLFMYAARISSFIKFEDSNSTAIEHRRVIDGRTYVVAKFMSQKVMEAYFQENYNQFLKLKNNSTKKARNKAEAKDIFKSHVDTVRTDAYKKDPGCIFLESRKSVI